MDLIFLSSFFVSLLIIYINRYKFTYQKQIEYNNFADDRCYCGIRNIYNVISNMIFLIGGIYQLLYNGDIILCLASILVCLGSSYYHWNPTLDTLFYDRLPMVLTFSWLLITHSKLNIIELVIYNFNAYYSLYIWKTQRNLLLYSAVQLSLILYWLLCLDCGMTTAILFYFAAKICEDNDRKIYMLTNRYISGHTLKHIFAGCALFFI